MLSKCDAAGGPVIEDPRQGAVDRAEAQAKGVCALLDWACVSLVLGTYSRVIHFRGRKG